MQPGKHILVLIPKGADAQEALLRVEAEAKHVGTHCTDMYFQELNFTGAWAEAKQKDGYRFRAGAGSSGEGSTWTAFGPVYLKVVHGSTRNGIHYLNLYVRRLGHAGFSVGGLLGDDDHTEAATPDERCSRRGALALYATEETDDLAEWPVFSTSSVEASLNVE